MKNTKFLKALSYVVLSISIVILILSVMCIAIKNSDYLNEDKYFKSEKFAYNYLMTLQDSADRLIHNNSLYDSVKDGDMNIYYLDMQNSYSNYTTIKNMNFLIIYKNKAITNIRKNTINQIKEYINSSQDSKTKKVDILDGSIQTDSESISQYGDKYLDNFLITYYTTDTIRTDTKLDDGRYIEYISAEAKDFEIYSSYTEELNLSTERQMATSFLNMVAPINNNVYVFFPISALLTLLLIIYLTSVIGHDDNEDSTININTFDRIPIEIIAFCAMLIGCMPFILLEFAENDYNAINSIAITAYFDIYICTAITMTTVIKRIKANQFIKTSIIGKVLLWCLKICKKIINKIKEIWNTITYSPNTTAKVIITTGLTVFVWLIIIAISGNGPMFPIIMIVLIGFVLYKIIKIFKEYLQIEKKLKDIYEGNTQSNLDEKSVENIFKNSVIYLNDISNGFENAVQDRMKSERMKAE